MALNCRSVLFVKSEILPWEGFETGRNYESKLLKLEFGFEWWDLSSVWVSYATLNLAI